MTKAIKQTLDLTRMIVFISYDKSLKGY